MKKLILAAIISGLAFPLSGFAQTPVAPLRVNPNTGAVVDQANFWTGNSGNITSALGLGTAATSNATAFVSSANGTATNLTVNGTLTGNGSSLTGVLLPTGNNTITGNWTLNAQSATIGRIQLPETSANSDSILSFGDPARGNNLSFRGSSQELILSSRTRVAIVSDQAFFGTGFIQLGNNSWNSEIVFLSSEGTSTANVTSTGSHRLALNQTFWNGSSAVQKTSVIQGVPDSSGNGTIKFFPIGNNSSGSYNGTSGRYEFSSGTEALEINSGGLKLSSGAIRGLQSSASGSPSVTGNSSATTGFGFAGVNWELIRSGTVLITSDATYGSVFGGLPATFNSRVQLSAGSSGFNSLHRTDDTTTGFYFPSAATIAFQTGGTERLRLSSGGVTIGGNGTAMLRVRHGTATLTAGTVTVSDSTVTTSARILVTRSNINASTAIGSLGTGTITPSTSFVINSRKADATIETNDASTVSYMIVEP